MARRWSCPQCGQGVLAPERMRKLDPRRYCLPCSGKAGVTRLVERTCPTLEARRERAAARQSTKLERQRSAREALPYTHRHDLIRRDFAALLKLPEWRASFATQAPYLSKIRNRSDSYSTGRCWVGSRRIVLTLGAGETRDDVIRLMVHELTHAYLPRGTHHNDSFKAVNAEMQRQAVEAGFLPVPPAPAVEPLQQPV